MAAIVYRGQRRASPIGSVGPGVRGVSVLLDFIVAAALVLTVAAGSLIVGAPASGSIDAEQAIWTPVGPGVHHAAVQRSANGSSHYIQVLRVERDNPYASLVASLGRGQVEGVESVSAQALRIGHVGNGGTQAATRAGSASGDRGGAASGAESSVLGDLLLELLGERNSAARTTGSVAVVGGVNADFFAAAPTPGLPIGIHMENGELVISPNDRPAFGVRHDGTPVVGIPEMSGAVWREQPPPWATEGGLDSDGESSGEDVDELFMRATVTAVNRPPNGLGLVLYTPRFGSQTPAVAGTVVTVRGVVEPVVSGRTYTGVVARVEDGRGATPVRAAIPADGVVLAARGPAEVLLEDLSVGEWIQFRVNLAPPFDDVKEAVAGWPVIVQDGEALPLNNGDNLVSGRHPRTAVGFNDEYIFIVTVDGRQNGWSNGMTLRELAAFMVELGATEALNLDGGGSTTMVLRPPGEVQSVVANRPSDGHERSVANALFVVSTAPPGPLAALHVRPTATAVLAGAALPLEVLGQDGFNNPVTVDPADVTWAVNGDDAAVVVRDDLESSTAPGSAVKETASSTVAHSAPFALQSTAPGTVSVSARVGDVTADFSVDVVTTVARAQIVPDIVHLAAGETAPLDVVAHDADGRRVWVEPAQLTWSVAADAVVDVDSAGRITGLVGGEAVVHARLGDAVASAAVTVDRAPVLLSDFETAGEWFANAVRAQASLSLVEPPEPAPSGRLAGQLVYDLSVSPGGTAAAYVQATTPIPIPDRPRAIGIWVYGDVSGHWLRANYIDGDGQRQVVDLTAVGGLDWVGWRFVQADIPADAVLPLTFERVYVVEMHRERQGRGVLYFDDLVALYGQS